MKIKPLILPLLVLGGQVGMAQTVTQDVITSSGGSLLTPDVSLSWTIGEPVSEMYASSTNYLTEGFEQPQTIVVTNVTDPSAPSGNLNVYPNPFTSIVSLENNNEGQYLNIQLTDMDGKVVLEKTMTTRQEQFDLAAFSNGMYFLRVYDTDNKLVQTLKIDKVK